MPLIFKAIVTYVFFLLLLLSWQFTKNKLKHENTADSNLQGLNSGARTTYTSSRWTSENLFCTQAPFKTLIGPSVKSGAIGGERKRRIGTRETWRQSWACIKRWRRGVREADKLELWKRKQATNSIGSELILWVEFNNVHKRSGEPCLLFHWDAAMRKEGWRLSLLPQEQELCLLLIQTNLKMDFF